MGSFSAFRRRLGGRPGVRPVYVTIAVRLKMEGLTIEFRRVNPSGFVGREHRTGLRGLHKRLDAPFSVVPLVEDDAEFQALVALRCVQQNHRAHDAYEVLKGYAPELVNRTGIVGDPNP